MGKILLETALKQRLIDLQTQHSELLEQVQELEDNRYSAMFTDVPPIVGTIGEIVLLRRQIYGTLGQITEVKFWLFEILEDVG